MRAFEFHVVQKVAAQLCGMRHADHGRICHALRGLKRKLALDPAGGAIAADAAFRQRMLETQEPGSRGNWRAFHTAGDNSARHDSVDKKNLRHGERFLHGVDGDFLTNVVSPFAQDRRPSDVEFGGGIFKFDADLPAG